MSEEPRYLRTGNPTDIDIDDVIRDSPLNFQTYVKEEELLCWRSTTYNRGPLFGHVDRVFWSRERPQARCSQIVDAIANPEITEKIKSLLQKLGLGSNILVQFWKAIEEIRGRRFLITRDQPFCITSIDGLPLFLSKTDSLYIHKLISLDYKFYVDDEEDLGLIGRVFKHQQVESTPNVGYYSSKEYPQGKYIGNAGCFALPLFELSGCCVGVLEILHYFPLLPFYSNIKDKICRTLEDVGLKGLETCNHLYGQNKDKDEALEGALVEIKEGLDLVCGAHGLPLAQTWVFCRICNALFVGRSFNFRTNAEYSTHPFIDICALHQLRKGQGVVGRAFSSHNLVFCKDISQFIISEYPLAHYARDCGITGSFAICLRSSYTGDGLYVMEFFLPPSSTEGGCPRTTLVSLFATMRQHFRSFQVASGEELGEGLPIEVIDFSKDDKLDSIQIPQTARSPDRPKTLENGGETVLLDSSNQQLMEADAMHTGNNVVGTAEKSDIAITSSHKKCIIKSSPRQHRNAGIPISLEDLQKQCGKKLNDAAESLGVSRSTLKRACREYGIKWWQRCKRNKDNHSLPSESVCGVAHEQIRDSSQPPISDPPREQDKATAVRTNPHSMAVEHSGNVTIKAKYGDVFIKFQLPVSSGMVEFQQQVAKRLNLDAGTYSVRYKDDDDDWILIACDEDLKDYISKSISRGWDTVKMLLQLITNCPP